MPAGSDEKKDALAGDYLQIAETYGKNLKGKQAIVTGANTGLGYETARALSACGVNVIVASRNPQKSEPAVKDLNEKDKSAGNGKVEFKLLDLASLQSVRVFAEDFLKRDVPLDFLVANASAWMVGEEKSPTVDGFEYQAASGYFGHIYLIELLKEKLISSAPSRLVWTTSAGETLGSINWDNLEMTDRTSNFVTYCTQKLYIQMATRFLDTKLKEKNVRVYNGQPGMCSTDFFNPEKFDLTKWDATSQWIMQKFMGLKPEEGALPLIYSALAPSDELKGAETGMSMGPEYFDLGIKQLPQITNKGLIRYQEPQNDDVKDFKKCERMYKETIAILQSKPVVKDGPQLNPYT